MPVSFVTTLQSHIQPDVVGAVVAVQAIIAAFALTLSLVWHRRPKAPSLRCWPRMSRRQFQRKWSVSELKDRTEEAMKQEFLLDLLATVGFKTPAEADPSGTLMAFEFLVTTRDGTLGFIDLVVDHAAIEVKRPGTPLAGALAQLEAYTATHSRFSVLIATNLNEIVVRWKGIQYRFTVASLNRRELKLLRHALTSPERLRPRRFGFQRLLPETVVTDQSSSVPGRRFHGRRGSVSGARPFGRRPVIKRRAAGRLRRPRFGG